MASLGHESESKHLEHLIDSIPSLIHTARPDGYLDYFNQRWLQYVGLPIEDLLGWKWTAVIHPEDVEVIVEKWRLSIARRFQQWVRSGQLEKALRILTEKLRQEGKLNPDEGWIDGSFAVAKKGPCSGQNQAGQGKMRNFPDAFLISLPNGPLTATDFGHQAALSGPCFHPSWRQKRKDSRYNE